MCLYFSLLVNLALNEMFVKLEIDKYNCWYALKMLLLFSHQPYLALLIYKLYLPKEFP